jgi:acyl-CoA thioester hydrolase
LVTNSANSNADSGDYLTVSHIRVPYSDTDAMGIVFHARYFNYFEAGREAYLVRCGVDFRGIFESGHNLPLCAAGLQCRSPARFGDLLEVQVQIDHLTRARLRFGYRIRHATNGALEAATQVVAGGWTEHVFTDAHLNLRRFPRELMAKLLLPNRDQRG